MMSSGEEADYDGPDGPTPGAIVGAAPVEPVAAKAPEAPVSGPLLQPWQHVNEPAAVAARQAALQKEQQLVEAAQQEAAQAASALAEEKRPAVVQPVAQQRKADPEAPMLGTGEGKWKRLKQVEMAEREKRQKGEREAAAAAAAIKAAGEQGAAGPAGQPGELAVAGGQPLGTPVPVLAGTPVPGQAEEGPTAPPRPGTIAMPDTVERFLALVASSKQRLQDELDAAQLAEGGDDGSSGGAGSDAEAGGPGRFLEQRPEEGDGQQRG
jgi:hypothetical protein